MQQLDTNKLKQLIGFKPTNVQQMILEGLKRWTIGVGGKRVGKTYLLAYVVLRELLYSNRNIWVVTPTYDLGKRIWDYLDVWVNRHFSGILEINKTEHYIKNIAQNSIVEFKTADNEISLKGKGLSLLIVDEAGDIDDLIWDKYLRPNISESRPELGGEMGRVFITGNASRIGTWFHRLHTETSIQDKFIFQLPTAIEDGNGRVKGTNNPLVMIDELQAIKDTSSSRVWKQEYLAQWLPGEGQVFVNIKSCIKDMVLKQPPLYGRKYLIGVDLARKQDFTVICVIDTKNFEVVDFQRFNTIDWLFQKEKIYHTAKHYNNAMVTIDATGLGDVIQNDLQRAKVNVNPVILNIETKKNVIEKLSLMIETSQIKFPEIPELIGELESYEYKLLPTGKVSYNAPQGLHDDCVIGLALACWQLHEKAVPLPATDMVSAFHDSARMSFDNLAAMTALNLSMRRSEGIDDYE